MEYVGGKSVVAASIQVRLVVSCFYTSEACSCKTGDTTYGTLNPGRNTYSVMIIM